MNKDTIHFDSPMSRLYFGSASEKTEKTDAQYIGDTAKDSRDHPDETQRRDPSIGQGRHTNVEPREHAKA